MAGDPAELAYGHALAMLGNPDAASDVAIIALRRAGRARGLVLAHARQEAITRAIADEPVDIDSLPTVVLDLPALAATLASTRPPDERAALDVRARTGGDLAALGEALGTHPTDAADKCTAIAESWERSLDPALLAFSGPGDCEALAKVLTETPLETVADLLAAAPAVHAHVEDCTVCTDRVRAMASVRSFFSDSTVDVPEAVRDAGRANRTKRPSAAPAPLFGGGEKVGSGRFAGAPLRVAAVAIAVAAVATSVMFLARGEDSEGQVSLATLADAASGLRLDARGEGGYVGSITLHNDTDRPVRYTLSTSAEWLRLSPAQGRLAPHSAVPVVAALTDEAPEGDAFATVIVQASGGAAISQELTWRVERAPQLATSLDGCAVNVAVVDDGDLASLILHWRDVADHQLDITNHADGYGAELRPDNGPVTYWVTAADTRGNAARTADGVISPGAC